MSVDFEFEIEARPRLMPEERDPFAVMFVTADLSARPAFDQTDDFGERLWIADSPTRRTDLKYKAGFLISPSDKVFDDASLCVQLYCEIPNHREEKSSHRCGFCAFSFRSMYEVFKEDGTLEFRDVLKDNGPPSEQGRGMVSVKVTNGDALERLFGKREIAKGLLRRSPSDPELVRAHELCANYHNQTDEIFGKFAPTDQKIVVPRLPMYVLSGGMSMPSCAFLRFDAPPFGPDEYYEAALRTAIRRNWPFEMSDDVRFANFLRDGDDAEMWNEKASVLMDAATLHSTSCPYLYDYGMTADGERLTIVDEFVRTGARVSLALDCEDGAVESLTFLWYVLENAKSDLLRMARKIRMQYVVTIALKAVTRPSQSNGGDAVNGAAVSEGSTFAAHACCDMVPLRTFAKAMHPKSDAVSALLREREADLLSEVVSDKLRVVVGETTGLVRSYVPADRQPDAKSRKSVRATMKGLFRSTRVVETKDLGEDSDFYRHAVSALVHDTRVSPACRKLAEETAQAWVLPQVVYCLRSGRDEFTYGVPHADYVRGEKFVIFAAKDLPLDVCSTITALAKFESPVPPLEAPPKSPSSEYPNYATISSILRKSFRDISGGGDGGGGDGKFTTVSVALHTMDEKGAEELVERCERAPPSKRRAFLIAPITEWLANVFLFFG